MNPNPSKRTSSILLGFIAVAGTFPLTAQIKTVYIPKNLGTLGGNSSDARGINEKGEVVGVAKNSAGTERAFLWVNGVMTDLGTLGGNASIATAISQDGDVVGSAQDAGGDYRATQFSRVAAPFNSDISPNATSNGSATCNNDRGGGEAAGFVDVVNPNPGQQPLVRAFRQPGFVPLIPVLMATLGGSENRAFGINESGDIVGSSLIAGDAARKAFVFTGGNMINIGDLGGTNSEARDINNSGRIVGWSSIPGGAERAFVRFNGTNTSLGSLGGNSYAHAINDSGDIVGVSLTGGAGTEAAFLYRNATMVNLNTMLPPNSGWNLQYANGINERGQIIGYGTFNGQGRAFLLDPDRKAPVVKPAVKGISTIRPRVKIKGTATDEGVIEAVQVQPGNGPFRKAKGTNQWSFNAKLKPGRNVLQIRARDTAGNSSRPKRVIVTRS